MRTARAVLLATVIVGPLHAQQEEQFDYWAANHEMIRRGMQALFMCNGVFTSNRTLDQIYRQELAYIEKPIGNPAGGDDTVDQARKAVAVGTATNPPIMRSAFRPGLGCVVMAPDQTFDDIPGLPSIDMPPLPGDPATIPWPDGDLVTLRRITFEVAGRDAVALGERGWIDCYVVRVDAGQPWTFWISTTRRPVPVVQLKIE